MTATGSSPSARSPAPKKPNRRIMAIWLWRLAIDRWRQKHSAPERDAQPVALIGETAHGPRIAAANVVAFALGIRPNMLLADARGLCPELATAPADPEGDLAFLERLAVWAQRWGPWSALDRSDGLLVDVTAVAHLFGGEDTMLAEAQTRFAGQGLSARLAIAPTAGAAWALAHYGTERAILPSADAAGGALAPLPVAALRLEPEVLLVLRRLGLKRIGDLYAIDRDALRRRFRSRDSTANPLVRLDQLLGRAAEPLLPVVASEMPLVQRGLMEPIRYRDLLDRVVRDLAEDLAGALETNGEGARRLELGLWRIDGETVFRSLELAAASRDPAHIARLFGAKLDDVDAGFGIELVRLAAPWCEKLALAQQHFEAADERPGTSLAVCLDRLTVRLGAQAVRRPVPFASHLPERAQRWREPLASEPGAQAEWAFHARPLKLLDRAEPIAVLYATPDGFPRRFSWRGQAHDIARVEGPERIAPEWWRERSTARLRDYYRIEDGEGRRYWIYRHGLIGDGRGASPEWFLQGLFA